MALYFIGQLFPPKPSGPTEMEERAAFCQSESHRVLLQSCISLQLEGIPSLAEGHLSRVDFGCQGELSLGRLAEVL